MLMQNASTNQCQFLTVEQVIACSGLSDSTIRRWIAGGVLPHAQPGGKRSRILIAKSALERLLQTEVPVPAPVAQLPVEVKPPNPQRSGPTPKWLRSVVGN